MPRLTVLVAFLALAAIAGATGSARAMEYGRDAANPACATMRNNTPGVPNPPEPNRADTRAAMALAGGKRSINDQLLDHLPVFRQRYAEAFRLMRKIDAEGTAALAALPPSTPNIDTVIDRQVINLVWARSMLALFYEDGRAPPVDYAEAAKFSQKSFDTQFTDDRGCVHHWSVSDDTLIHLAGYYAYGIGLPQDKARAKILLQQAGPQAEPILYLLDHDALPKEFGDYLTGDLDQLADAVKNPAPAADNAGDTALYLLGLALLWFAVAVALFVGAVGLFRSIRRKQGHKDEASFYRSLFAVYDVIHHVVARFGLVAEGLIGCFLGLSILGGGLIFGDLGVGYNLGASYNAIIIVSGVSAFLGGLAKLIEAARLSAAPGNTRVHGAARPAAEPEATAAARGDARTGDLHDRTFSE